jgi:2-(1,2-epoxy-1,2-dihydrophenyl)acetyl-CoA isomerase
MTADTGGREMLNAGDGQDVLMQRSGNVAVLTLNRPQARNAIHAEMALTLVRMLDEIDADASVRAVVLQGSGGAFSAGGDIRKTASAGPRTSEQRLAAMAPFHRLATTLVGLGKPVVAAIDGVAFGAGFSLALMADLVLLSDRARLCMAFQRVGLIPDMGALYLLPRAVGMQRARELLFSAREIDAQEALAIGIALAVVPPDALASRALELANGMASASPLAIALTKQALSRTFQSDLQAVLAFEAAAQAVATGSDYLTDAVERFAARQPPQFQWPEAS